MDTPLTERIRDWAGQRPTAEDSRSLWLGLFVAAVLLAVGGGPPRLHLFDLIVVVATLFISLRFRIGYVGILVLVLIGMHLRFLYLGPGTGSDVLAVTRSAIDTMVAGGNPYGHGYASTIPPGGAYAYGPIALVWYQLWPDLGRIELGASLLILGMLAARGRGLGLAVYAG
ncbi:MAG: hypothetical protein ABIZ34_06480, partial [Candidatus Limnocylindrales bacterium]